jgi:hypothetical protein
VLTVKFRNQKTQRTRNVECREVVVEPAEGSAVVVMTKEDKTVEEVRVQRANGSEDPALFHVAFVENHNGSTIQVVRP